MDVARAASVQTSMPLGFLHAREGRGHEIPFQALWSFGGRHTGGNGEEVDELQDEEARKGAAKVGHAER